MSYTLNKPQADTLLDLLGRGSYHGLAELQLLEQVMSTHKQAADKQAESCVLAIDEGKKNLLIEMLDRVTWRGFQETVMLSQIISILNGATFVLTNIPITKP